MSLKIITAAPHRLLFLSGSVQCLLTIAWWLMVLESGMNGLNQPADALAPHSAHAWLMLFGLFPFFVFGFAFTAVPNWLDGPKIRPSQFVTTGLLLNAGVLLFYPGIYWPGLGLLAVLLHALGLAVGLASLWHSLAGSAAPDKRHAWSICLALLAGLAGDLCFFAWLLGGAPAFLALAFLLMSWGCLAPIFLTVCHRMIPWFTSRILSDYVMVRPYALLWLMLLASWGHVALEAIGRDAYTWLADIPMTAIAVYFILRWGIARSFGVRLLAMLHVSFVWAAVAFGLATLSSLGRFFDWAWSGGHAAMHALGIGFFGTMLIAMASRVSLGHSGNKLEADSLTWLLFWLLQLAALVRLLPDLLPGVAPYRLVSVAAVIWMLAFGGWFWRYAPLFWRPRADGKAG